MSHRTDPDDFDGEHSLYRMFDDAGRLLYVGVSRFFPNRFNEHRLGKFWWRKVALVKVEHLSTRAEALAAELRAIEDDHPLYNSSPAIGRAWGPKLAPAQTGPPDEREDWEIEMQEAYRAGRGPHPGYC